MTEECKHEGLNRPGMSETNGIICGLAGAGLMGMLTPSKSSKREAGGIHWTRRYIMHLREA